MYRESRESLSRIADISAASESDVRDDNMIDYWRDYEVASRQCDRCFFQFVEYVSNHPPGSDEAIRTTRLKYATLERACRRQITAFSSYAEHILDAHRLIDCTEEIGLNLRNLNHAKNACADPTHANMYVTAIRLNNNWGIMR